MDCIYVFQQALLFPHISHTSQFPHQYHHKLGTTYCRIRPWKLTTCSCIPPNHHDNDDYQTPSPEVTRETVDFFVSDAEGDPDRPSPGYSSIEQAISELRREKGDLGNGQDVLVRVHSECLTGDIFGSRRCDCGNQLDLAMRIIEEAGRGVLVYLCGHEGRGIGLAHKLRAYNLQDQGHDTVQANLELGFAADSREYGIGAQILHDIGVHTMRLMTNNPAKFAGLRGYGLAVVGRVPVMTPITEDNERYLETKRVKMGHVYGSDLVGPSDEFIKPENKCDGDSDTLPDKHNNIG